MCEEGNKVKTYKVSFGRGGLEKTVEGDSKTPLGTYSLGEPRASEPFSVFVPIRYPTEEQRALGYTGNSIGIHGPARYFVWLGHLNTWMDWTNGCIAVGTDEEISEIAQWVLDSDARKIVIRKQRSQNTSAN